MNRLDIELSQLKSDLLRNNEEYKKSRAKLEFFNSFNEAKKRKEILDLIDIFRRKSEELDSISMPSASIAIQPTGFLWKLFGLAGSHKTQQKPDEAMVKRKRYREILEFEIEKINEKIKEGQALIEQYKSLDEYQIRAMVKVYECREEIIKGKIQSVEEKLEKLRRAVGPLFENAAQYRQQVRNYEEGLKDCQAYSEKLSDYQNFPVRRRKVDEAHAEKFHGNDCPSDVAADLKKKLEAARRHLITKFSESRVTFVESWDDH